jgi:myo-inositol-1-phosphate synthase
LRNDKRACTVLPVPQEKGGSAIDVRTSGTGERVGVWLLGSRGSVATTTVAGARAVVHGLAPPTGLVTLDGAFSGAGLPALDDLVFGGHDVVDTPLVVRASRLVDGGVIPHGLVHAIADDLALAEERQRPGIGWLEARTEPRAAVDRAAADLRAFRSADELDRVVVINLCSTEPPVDPHPAHADPDDLLEALDRGSPLLPPSSLYALAAIETGCAFVDFTPSTGARLPALEALAEAHEVPLAGRDGKTGETFVKTALAPAFAARNLRVRSWAGMNLLGGGDGAALAEPDRARSKLASKARSLEEILGYPVEAPVRIDRVEDLGEWKTAWDHVTFEGFLGVRMRMQFVWEGCDSALAAPLLLDLARFGALALERGETGVVPELAFFFKDPAGTHEHALQEQYATLQRWVLQEVPA